MILTLEKKLLVLNNAQVDRNGEAEFILRGATTRLFQWLLTIDESK